MKFFSLIVFSCSLLFSQDPQTTYDKFLNDLNTLSVDKSRSAEVKNVSLKRDRATITLDEGVLYILSPINDSRHALLFIGSGRFHCVPPTEIERKQLYRFTEKESLNTSFENLFLLFTDSTFEELSRKVNFSSFNSYYSTIDKIKRSLGFIKNHKDTGFDFDIARTFLLNEQSGFFYAQLSRGSNSYFYSIDPYDDEPVSISQNISNNFILHEGKARETICQFPLQQQITNALPNISYDISSYAIESDIDKRGNFSSKCVILINNFAPNRKWIPFVLSPKLIVDSVFIDGKKMTKVQLEEYSVIWFGSPESIPTTRETNITMFYKGKFITKDHSVYHLESSMGWYPLSMENKKYALFDLSFRTPSDLQLIGFGEKVSAQTDNDVTTSRWRLSKPGRNASFMFGKFDEQHVSNDSLPPISVYITNTVGNDVKNETANKEVADDIANSIRFFQHTYGPAISNSFSAVEIFSTHGEAFPGLIHLSALTFRDAFYNDGTDETFRAHEVAHQWWGIGVDFKTYHDQWLSEAFAEYSGLWFMQTVLHDNKKFFEKLEKYKESILHNRKYLFGLASGQEAGPIWLGRRTSSAKTTNDYSLIIYRKGAWVLHMLRNLALDLKTMDESIFREMMKDFYTTHAGKQATTDDFQKTVERNFGVDMRWFFKQWIYNTEIPTYNITYKLIELPGNKYKVHCTVKQTNVADDFQMSVPFFIDFGDKKFARLRFLIKGPVTEFDFPVLPLKPVEIKFNDLESVLCEIDDEEWD